MTPTINNSNAESYPASQTFITQKRDKREKWYLNSYVLRYICHNHERFLDFQPKIYIFVIVNRNIIRLTQVKIVIFLLRNDLKLIFFNITYTLEYNFNFHLFKPVMEN